MKQVQTFFDQELSQLKKEINAFCSRENDTGDLKYNIIDIKYQATFRGREYAEPMFYTAMVIYEDNT